MTTYARPTTTGYSDATLSAAFRKLFESHPSAETDPALALQSARESFCERYPGVEGSFDDAALSFAQDAETIEAE